MSSPPSAPNSPGPSPAPAQQPLAALFSVLEDALANLAPYDRLSAAVQQQHTLPEYRSKMIGYCVAHGDSYEQLPTFVRTVLTEKRYAELTVTIAMERLQLYPYPQIHAVIQHTKETPLTYYSQMIALMLRAERSYDALPNFTAVDILQLLGIGRNQYLTLTKEVRSKLWWRVTRNVSLIRDMLPKELVAQAPLSPYAEVWLVDPTSSKGISTTATGLDVAKKVCDKDERLLAVWRRMLHRWKTNGSSFMPPALSAATTSQSENRRPANSTAVSTTTSVFAMESKQASESPTLPPASPESNPATASGANGMSGGTAGESRDGGLGSNASAAVRAAQAPSCEVSPSGSLLEGDHSRRASQQELTAPGRLVLDTTLGGASDALDCEASWTPIALPELAPRSHFYACELPQDAIEQLYRKGLVYTVFHLDMDERIDIPPLENFVMNRTSDDAQESLLYRVLATLDDVTSLDLLAQLLSEDPCRIAATCEFLVRLGLAKRRFPWSVPEDLAWYVAGYLEWSQRPPSAAASAVAAQDGAENPAVPGARRQSLVGHSASSLESSSTGQLHASQPSSEKQNASFTSRSRFQIVDDLATWSPDIEAEIYRRYCQLTEVSISANGTATTSLSAPLTSSAAPSTHPFGGRATLLRAQPSESESAAVALGATVAPPERHEKRIALLYDSSITGMLMMTNLSADPVFKHHAVTLFEAGKLTDHALQMFEEKLLSLDTANQKPTVAASDELRGDVPSAEDLHHQFSGEATKHRDSAVCLGKLLRLLRCHHLTEDLLVTDTPQAGERVGEDEVTDVAATSTDQADAKTPEKLLPSKEMIVEAETCMRDVLGCGVDMRKVEALNELEAKTRYLVLGRKYLSYFTISPLGCAPLLDLELDNIYGSTVALQPSAWMLLTLYRDMGEGPPSALFPFGARLAQLRPAVVLQPKENVLSTLRLVPMTPDAEASVATPHTCLVLLNTMLTNSPLFVQLVSHVPRVRQRVDRCPVEHDAFFTADVHLPFTSTDEEAGVLALRQLHALASRHRASRAAARNAYAAASTTTTLATGAAACASAPLQPPPPLLFPSDLTSGDAGSLPSEAKILLSRCCGPLLALFRKAVSVLQAQCSIGHLSFTVTCVDTWLKQTDADVYTTKVPPLWSPELESLGGEATAETLRLPFVVHSAVIVDVGFGFPLEKRLCCEALLTQCSTRALASLEQVQAHNAAMKRWSSRVLALMSQVNGAVAKPLSLVNRSPAAAAADVHLHIGDVASAIRKLALGGAEEAFGAPHLAKRGPSTQRHLRTLGANLNGGCPFPEVEVVFDGASLSVRDEWDPLTE